MKGLKQFVSRIEVEMRAFDIQYLLKKKAARDNSPKEVLYTHGNPATLSLESGLRPEALRPALSSGLPFTSKNSNIMGMD